jgi:hypothetical protein
MKERIVDDKGLRLRDGTWLDLADVREIHSVVTSLDDMPGIATATAKLAGAGLLPPDNIPWTVSLNDLDLVTQLVDRPAEFLLYLRRRTEPRATEMFMAVDELDLFLLFFRMGLYVEPDPEVASREMPSRNKFLGLSRATQMIWMRGTTRCTLQRGSKSTTWHPSPAWFPHPLPRSSTGSKRT